MSQSFLTFSFRYATIQIISTTLPEEIMKTPAAQTRLPQGIHRF